MFTPPLNQMLDDNYRYSDSYHLSIARSAQKVFVTQDFLVEDSIAAIGACTNCARPASNHANSIKNFFDYSAK